MILLWILLWSGGGGGGGRSRGIRWLRDWLWWLSLKVPCDVPLAADALYYTSNLSLETHSHEQW